jgi:hypothetical protein
MTALRTAISIAATVLSSLAATNAWPSLTPVFTAVTTLLLSANHILPREVAKP